MSTAGPVHRVQSAVEVYGYPQGHIGHLTADELNAFNDFKAVLIEKGLYERKLNVVFDWAEWNRGEKLFTNPRSRGRFLNSQSY